MAAGETTVTLTGEEASLHKALQKVIDQNLKMVGGFDKAKNKAKQLSDVDFSELNDTLDELGDLSSVFQSVSDSSMGKMVTSISLATMGMAAFKAVIDESIERFEILGKRQPVPVRRHDRPRLRTARHTNRQRHHALQIVRDHRRPACTPIRHQLLRVS